MSLLCLKMEIERHEPTLLKRHRVFVKMTSHFQIRVFLFDFFLN